jgi:hypothetical protein
LHAGAYTSEQVQDERMRFEVAEALPYDTDAFDTVVQAWS